MKKKILSLLVAICMFIPCLFMLTACGNDLVGSYTVYSATMGETTLTKADYDAKAGAGTLNEVEEELGEILASSQTLELKKDNTFVMTAVYGDETITTNGTWTEDGDKVTLNVTAEEDDEAEAVVLTVKDGKLVMTIEEDYSVTYAKK